MRDSHAAIAATLRRACSIHELAIVVIWPLDSRTGTGTGPDCGAPAAPRRAELEDWYTAASCLHVCTLFEAHAVAVGAARLRSLPPLALRAPLRRRQRHLA